MSNILESFDDVAPVTKPRKLEEIPQWLNHINKEPYCTRTGESANDITLGVPYQEAVAAKTNRGGETYDGAGIYLGNGLAGVDFDDCIKDQTISQRVAAIIRAHPEMIWRVSPSGTGIHGYGYGVKPGSICRKGKAEIYDSKRYFRESGVIAPGSSEQLNDVDFTDIYAAIERGDFVESAAEKSGTSEKTTAPKESVQIQHTGTALTSKYELFMHGTVSGDKPTIISDEFGNSVTYVDRSAADLAFANEAAIKRNGNADAIWSDYLQSAIYRERWGKREEDFRRLTIAKAVESYERFKVAKSANETPTPATAFNAPVDCRSYFRSVGQLKAGGTVMLVDGFLPEGVSMIGALPAHCKTLFSLSLAKALTTGKPFLSRFKVPVKIPVIYLIPESSGGSFRTRCEKFGIPDDPELFLCRTVSEGRTLLMDDPILKEIVALLKPVVILDTAVRFNQSPDENSSSGNKKFVDDSLALIQSGARGVIGLHHATKASNNEPLTLENALRGTGDIGAMADAVYGLKRKNALYDNGNGPLEIEVVCLKPRDFEPPMPFTIAATAKVEDTIISHIDTKGDFNLLDISDILADLNSRFVELVTKEPELSLAEVAEGLGIKKSQVQTIMNKVKFRKPRNGVWCPAVSLVTVGTTAPVKEVAY